MLGDGDRLLAASSPTGPAFEGAQISGGQRAAPGAIERVRIDRDTLEPRFRVIGVEPLVRRAGLRRRRPTTTGITGICGSGIVEVIAELFLAGVITEDGVVDGALAARTPRIVADGRTLGYVLHEGVDGGPRMVITQNDVRAIQLAKAALYAGVRLLMDHLGIDAVDEIRLAGAFGSQIDPTHAMILGLIPDCDLAHVRSGGQRRRDRRADRAAVRARPGARSRASSARSRRSRPPSSRGSRSTSSRRWRSPTRPPRSRTSSAVVTLPPRAEPGDAAGRGRPAPTTPAPSGRASGSQEAE